MTFGSTQLRRWWRRNWERTREAAPKAAGLALRLGIAVTIAFAVADAIFPGTRPIVAPLTTLLVVQVTLYNTLRTGVQRIASVVAGVLLAVGFSTVFGFTWWSLGLLVAVTVVIGRLLRLRDQLLEVPISAMLIMAVGGAETPATNRITETLVGAAVGIAYNVVLPGNVGSRSAGEAVEDFAGRMAALLDTMADGLLRDVSVEDAERWLEGARDLDHRVARVDQALVFADESRRLNVRALGTKDPGPILRSGLDALEHCTVTLRGLCRAIVDQLRERPDEGRIYSGEVREVFVELAGDLASAVRAYGTLVRREAEPTTELNDEQLAAATKAVREARGRLAKLLLDSRRDLGLWELNGTILSSVERVLREIDPGERARQRERREREWAARPPAVHAVERLRTTSRQVAERPIRRVTRLAPSSSDRRRNDETDES